MKILRSLGGNQGELRAKIRDKWACLQAAF
jgi:hypothetical protein